MINKNMKLKFKQGIYGIIYDSVYGDITEITNPVTDDAKQLFINNNYMCLFTDVELITEVFNLDDEDKDVNYINKYWGDILEVVN
jgi:hypothetical protein